MGYFICLKIVVVVITIIINAESIDFNFNNIVIVLLIVLQRSTLCSKITLLLFYEHNILMYISSCYRYVYFQ